MKYFPQETCLYMSRTRTHPLSNVPIPSAVVPQGAKDSVKYDFSAKSNCSGSFPQGSNVQREIQGSLSPASKSKCHRILNRKWKGGKQVKSQRPLNPAALCERVYSPLLVLREMSADHHRLDNNSFPPSGPWHRAFYIIVTDALLIFPILF